jgi:predicted Zn-dependent protease
MPNDAANSPQETIERALSLSRTDGCVVIADESSTANLRWAGNTLTTNGVATSRALTVIAFSGPRAGVVTRAGVTPDQIEDVVREAEKAAGDADPAEDAATLVSAAGSSPSWDEPAARTGISVLGGFAGQLGEVLRESQASDRELYGFAEHGHTSTFLGSSTGLRLRHDQPTGRVELNAKSADLTRSAWGGVSTRDFSDVDVAALAGELAGRLDWQRRKVELPAGRYETILPPTAVADLMIYLYWTAGARDAAEGRTVFSQPGGGTRVGDLLAPQQPVTLLSDPAYPGLETAPFVVAHASGRDSSVFDNGLDIPAASWITAGELSALHSSRFSAARAGLPVTPAADNLVLLASDPAAPEVPDQDVPSLNDMIASTRRGLLLTCLWYIREVDPQTLLVTGLTRDGVYLIENGEVSGAVNNFRFNESPVGMLGRLTQTGATERTLPREWGDWFTRAAMPPLRIEGFNMSSVSQAS